MIFYVLEAEGYLKVGVTRNLIARQRTLQSSNPHLLRLVQQHQTENAFVVEQMVLQRCKTWRVRGEWLKDTPEVRDIIDQVLAAPVPNSLPRKPGRPKGSRDKEQRQLKVRRASDGHIVIPRRIDRFDRRTIRRAFWTVEDYATLFGVPKEIIEAIQST